jgi:hypothetical protein
MVPKNSIFTHKEENVKRLLTVLTFLLVVSLVGFGAVPVAADNTISINNTTANIPIIPPLNDISKANFSKCISPHGGVSDEPNAANLNTSNENLGGGGVSPMTQECFGTWVTNTSGVNGIYSYNTASTSLTLNQVGDQLDAPTLLGPGVCPLEIVTFYLDTSSGMQRKVTVYDHELENYNDFATINSSFLSKYTYNGYYIGEVVYSGGDWWAFIYDWTSYTWDAMYGPEQGKSWSQVGWDMFESYGLDTGPGWPTIPVINSNYLTIELNGNWDRVTPTYGSYMSPAGSIPYSYGFYSGSNYYDWYCGGAP